jgi:hypothetical protein
MLVFRKGNVCCGYNYISIAIEIFSMVHWLFDEFLCRRELYPSANLISLGD